MNFLISTEFEHETINWPAFLDNFALISSLLAGLSKQLALEYTPPIARLTVLPLHLSPDVDENLVQLTEGRLPVFSAECVPDYLRTKPDPTMESRMNLHEAKANALAHETAAKQVAQFSKIVSHVHDLISKARDEWEIESMNRNLQTPTFNQADTHQLVKAVGMGTNLKVMGGAVGMPGMIAPPGPRMPGPVQMSSVSPNLPQMGKLPSSIKTNIKSASLHPYR
jgi:mediator of RNA polymerase II transcription subunit 8